MQMKGWMSKKYDQRWDGHAQPGVGSLWGWADRFSTALLLGWGVGAGEGSGSVRGPGLPLLTGPGLGLGEAQVCWGADHIRLPWGRIELPG